ncbi:MAG TPA: DUF6632 domain-containing protein [Terriglobales bacterium]|nr:DUF6632 domain-containing protein [Terriglobales bacterium]
MKRERIRQVVLALVGLLYLALLYFLFNDLWHSRWLVDMNKNECEPMFVSFWVGLGFFLLLAANNPSGYRSLIVFAGWSSLLHGSVMAIQTVEAFQHGIHRDYTDVVVTAAIGAILLAAAPPKEASAPSLAADSRG